MSEITENDDELFEMLNLAPRLTGLPMTVWASTPGRAYQARPGRSAVVVPDLADLRGPVTGTVELPLWLFWSQPDRTFEQDPDDGFGPPPPVVSGATRLAADWQGNIMLATGETVVLGLSDKDERLDDVGFPAHDDDRSAFAELQSAPLPGLSPCFKRGRTELQICNAESSAMTVAGRTRRGGSHGDRWAGARVDGV